MKNNNVNEEQLVADYKNYVSVEDLTKLYKIGKLRVKEILANHDVELRHKGFSKIQTESVVKDWKIDKYPPIEGYYYVAVAKDSGKEFADVKNKAGLLTGYIHDTFGVEIPTLYDRRIYYQKTGDYWWEQWFDIVKRESKITKKCPYCDWSTVDLENKSGWFLAHIKKEHNISPKEHLKRYPEDSDYLQNIVKKINKKEKLENEDNYVICPICNKKFERITSSHIEHVHNINFEVFKKEYPNVKLMSKNNEEQAREQQKQANLTVSKNRFISKYEKEIQDFLKEHNVNFDTNRQILIGREIDILVEDKKIGIEFDGLKWHTEWFGRKPHRYHLEKTLKCNEKGYSLIHIFEDEYVNHKNIVLDKIGHALGLNQNLPKIAARKCVVKEIRKNDAETFLNMWHIQGYAKSSIYYGAFFNNELIAVMSFKNGGIKNPTWELNRFATSGKYVCQGVGGKLFKTFIRENNPSSIISFADRRWTLTPDNNLYTKLGFSLENTTPPDYRYYNEKVDRYKRIHKITFSKKNLIKKYGFPSTMTEKEMAKELGYDRIWDCGMFKYVWYNEDK